MAETKTFQKPIKEKPGTKSIKTLPARPISNLQNRAEQIVDSPSSAARHCARLCRYPVHTHIPCHIILYSTELFLKNILYIRNGKAFLLHLGCDTPLCFMSGIFGAAQRGDAGFPHVHCDCCRIRPNTTDASSGKAKLKQTECMRSNRKSSRVRSKSF